MCGRFTRMYTWHELVSLYHLSVPAMTNFQPRYNICPTDTIDVVVRGGDERALAPMRWGLIPAWWNKPLKEMRVATFNARSESIAGPGGADNLGDFLHGAGQHAYPVAQQA